MAQALDRYLNTHFLGSTTGLEMFRRATRRHPELATITAEVEQDRTSLQALMRAVGVTPRRHRAALGWLAEKLSRVQLDRSAAGAGLADLARLESLQLGVQGKAAGFRLLRALDDPRLDDGQLQALVERAERQAEQIEQLRLRIGREALG